MIWNGQWTIDKEQTESDVVEVENNAVALAKECWIHVEYDVEVHPGCGYYEDVKTKGNFTKLIVPETVCEIKERALYRCETVEDISILTNVTKIGKEAFKGCSGLCMVIAPLVKISDIEDPDTKLKLAMGFCLNEKLYCDEIAGDYLGFIKKSKTRIIRAAEKYERPEVIEYLTLKGFVK